MQPQFRRQYPCEISYRAADGGDESPGLMIGHAAVFNQLSEDLGGFREKIMPGCFTSSITEDDIRSLFNHSPNMVLGRNRNGTLRLLEDDKGLMTETKLPNTTLGRDIAELLRRGDITQMSFGFDPLEWDKQVNAEKEEVVYVLKKARLWDISPVTYPAYTQTDVSLRALWSELEKQNAGGSPDNHVSMASAARRANRHALLQRI